MGGDIAAENWSPGEGSERRTCTSDPQKRPCPADLGRVVQVLYLYSGSRRRGVLGRNLRRQGRKEGLCVVTRELDLLKGSPRHGLNARGRQQRVIAEIRTGHFHCIVVSPPAVTFSRARLANGRGPRPVRSRCCPRGLPRLHARARHTVLAANALVDFAAAVLKAQLDIAPETLGIIEHPEDLGALPNGKTPGTMWQFESVTDLLAISGVQWGALAQGLYGARSRKPTRIIGRVPGLDAILSLGAPQFDQRGVYIGPLVRGSTEGVATVRRGVGRDFDMSSEACG